MLGLQIGSPGFRANHLNRLRKYFGEHFDFYGWCLQRLNPPPRDITEIRQFIEAANAEMAIRCNGGRNRELHWKLRKIPTGLIMEMNDNALLGKLIEWNELALFSTDNFYVGVDPDDRVSCIVDPASPHAWIIDTTFGYRQLMSDLLIVFWEVCCDRFRGDPYAHLQRSFDQAFKGVSLDPYRFATLEQVAQTEQLAMFVKMFAFAHEIGHVNALKLNTKFSSPREEEVYADEFACNIYLSAALMMLPPFSTLASQGVVKNARERREYIDRIPSLRALHGAFDSKTHFSHMDAHAVFRASGLCRDEKELRLTSMIIALIWVAPIVIFLALEQLELRMTTGQSTCNSHPAARERIGAYWARCPDERMRVRIEQQFSPVLERLFGTT